MTLGAMRGVRRPSEFGSIADVRGYHSLELTSDLMTSLHSRFLVFACTLAQAVRRPRPAHRPTLLLL